jgi:predicted amidohydrolase YtcJ
LIGLVVAAGFLAGAFSCASAAGGVTGDLVFYNGAIYSMDAKSTTPAAVAVSGGRVVWSGDLAGAERLAGADARWIDLEGETMLPGLVDAHGHLKSLGRSLAQLQLEGTTSPGQVREMVLEAAKRSPAGSWIQGRGWDQNDWDVKEFPTWRDLEGVEGHAVFLRRVDGHAVWVNRKALELCGVTRDSADPEGGRIVRDADGNPTGILIDNAVDLVSVRIPDPTPYELDGWLLSAIRHCNSLGLVGMHDAGTTADVLESLDRISRRGELTLHVYCMLSSEKKDSGFLQAELERGPHEEAGGMVVVRAIKLYADGALGSRGAALLEAYSDDTGNMGLLIDSTEKLESISRQALERGFQVCTHAIGDRGNRVILDVYESLLSGNAGADRRFRVEHCQIVSPQDIQRFRKLGVIPSMQPTHATSDMYWAEARVGKERIAGAYAWRKFLDGGNRLPLGSDFPVESANPLWGIYAAVTRQDRDGWPDGGWYPEQRMTVTEAVTGFTVDAAYAEFGENDRGTIEVGKRADFTVIDRDIFRVPPSEILEARVTLTVVGGRLVYEREATPSRPPKPSR